MPRGGAEGRGRHVVPEGSAGREAAAAAVRGPVVLNAGLRAAGGRPRLGPALGRRRRGGKSTKSPRNADLKRGTLPPKAPFTRDLSLLINERRTWLPVANYIENGLLKREKKNTRPDALKKSALFSRSISLTDVPGSSGNGPVWLPHTVPPAHGDLSTWPGSASKGRTSGAEGELNEGLESLQRFGRANRDVGEPVEMWKSQQRCGRAFRDLGEHAEMWESQWWCGRDNRNMEEPLAMWENL